jgi:hypothetical protein
MAVPKTVGEIVAVLDGGVSQCGSPLRQPVRRHPARGGQVFTLDVSTRFFKSGQVTLSVASAVDAESVLSDVAIVRLTADRYV